MAAPSKLAVGNVVYLMSGGPAMTVSHVYEPLEMVECRWFGKGVLLQGKFRLDELTYDPGPEPVPGEPSTIRDHDPRKPVQFGDGIEGIPGTYVPGIGVIYDQTPPTVWPPSDPQEND